MVFEIDPDRPNIPAIARILWGLGLFFLIVSVVLVLLAFSRFVWVNPPLAVGMAVGAFVIAVLMLGQAKILELLAVVSARVKSRFAMEHVIAAQAAAPGEKKPPVAAVPPPARVISIPEQVAREQGVTRTPEPRDFR